MSFDKTRAEKIVSAALTMLPLSGHNGFTIRATPEAIEALKQSDSPFAGHVITCMVEDRKEARAHYDDWVNRSVGEAVAELSNPNAVTYSSEEVKAHLKERHLARKDVMARLKANFTREEIQMLGVIIHEEDND